VSSSSLPLIERFPELARIPRVQLVRGPTPVEPLPQLGKQIGYDDVWIKRDDLSGELYGGNKPRKLEFALGNILDKGYGSVVTMGGIGTNHGLATAIQAQRLGLGCHLVLMEQPLDEHVRQNLRLFHAFGASLHLASGLPAVGWKAARLLVKSLLASGGGRATFLGPGGTSALTSLGFVNAAFELKQQIERKEMETPAAVFLPAGSGGTMAGLVLGMRLCGLESQVLGVRVVDSFVAGPGAIAGLANRTLRLIRSHGSKVVASPFKREQVRVLEGYMGECYGAFTAESLSAVRLAAEHGIALETTYTGKALAALRDFVRTLSPGSGPVLFWNTHNSRDLSPQAEKVDWRELPEAFHRFFSPPS
jgi:D-cysteine desulfhydrase